MEETSLTPELVAFISVLYLFRSPGGLADIGNGFWWFIIPALTAQCISIAVKIVRKTVGPTTWKKLEEHANKAMRVACAFEMIAGHQAFLMMLSDSFWSRFVLNCSFIGIIGVGCVFFILDVVKGGKGDKVETGAVKNQIL